jgi:hypothetical protein
MIIHFMDTLAMDWVMAYWDMPTLVMASALVYHTPGGGKYDTQFAILENEKKF